jgi:hypothetical protein
MSFLGALKNPETVFGSRSIFADPTFITSLIIAFFAVIVGFFSEWQLTRLGLQRLKQLGPLLLFSVCLAVAYAANPSEVGLGKLRQFFVFILPASVIFVFLVQRAEDLTAFLCSIMFAGLFFTGIAFIFQTPHPFLFLATGETRSWGTGTYIVYGPMATSAGLIALAWMLESQQVNIRKGAFFFLAIFCFAGTIYSGERGSILFVPVILFLYVLIDGRLLKFFSTKKGLVFLAAIILAGLLGFVWLFR